MPEYRFNKDKNYLLKQTRGIGFEEVIGAVAQGKLLAIELHPNPKYRNQSLFIVEINAYVYVVPCIFNHKEVFLKTIYPSRKHTKKYLLHKGA